MTEIQKLQKPEIKLKEYKNENKTVDNNSKGKYRADIMNTAENKIVFSFLFNIY